MKTKKYEKALEDLRNINVMIDNLIMSYSSSELDLIKARALSVPVHRSFDKLLECKWDVEDAINETCKALKINHEFND